MGQNVNSDPDTPGSSQWYFNFLAKTLPKQRSGHHRASAGGVQRETRKQFVAVKLKCHRLKPVVSKPNRRTSSLAV